MIAIDVLTDNGIIDIDITAGQTVTIYPTPSTYKINFQSDSSDPWGIYSKFNGNMTEVILENVSSYTIDGVSESLPFEVKFNQTYLIDIVKTNPSLEASITFSTTYITFDEIQDMPDFSIGDGRWTYLIGDNTDITTNRTLLKYDNELLTPSNYLGAGTWTVAPLSETLTLPELPVNGWWKLATNIKTGEMLISGYNTSTNYLYFCKVNILGEIYDLNGVVNSYTELSAGKKFLRWSAYNYVDDFVYFHTFNGGTNALVMLNLNTNTIDIDLGGCPLNYFYGYNTKLCFNPYLKSFITEPNYDIVNRKSVVYPSYIFANSYYSAFSRKTNRYYKSAYSRYLDSFDSDGNFISQYRGATTPNKPTRAQSFDQDNEVSILYGNMYIGIYRINDANYGFFQITDIEAGETRIENAVSTKNNIHIGLSNVLGRIHIIDTTDPANTIKADFGYLDLPVKCWDINTNKLI